MNGLTYTKVLHCHASLEEREQQIAKQQVIQKTKCTTKRNSLQAKSRSERGYSTEKCTFWRTHEEQSFPEKVWIPSVWTATTNSAVLAKRHFSHKSGCSCFQASIVKLFWFKNPKPLPDVRHCFSFSRKRFTFFWAARLKVELSFSVTLPSLLHCCCRSTLPPSTLGKKEKRLLPENLDNNLSSVWQNS